MSTDQPQPGSGGEPPEQDPFRKQQPPPPPPPPQYGQGYGQGSPYDGPYGSPQGGAYGAPDPLAGMPPLASRGKRLLARIIDALIIGIPVFAILAPTGTLTSDDGSVSYTTGGYWQGLVYTLVYFVYEGLMLTNKGQTLGKMLMKVRVGMVENGSIPAGNPGWMRAGIYSLPAIVPCLGTLFWLVNVLFCTWDKPYQQCVHDKGAKTVVVAA